MICTYFNFKKIPDKVSFWLIPCFYLFWSMDNILVAESWRTMKREISMTTSCTMKYGSTKLPFLTWMVCTNFNLMIKCWHQSLLLSVICTNLSLITSKKVIAQESEKILLRETIIFFYQIVFIWAEKKRDERCELCFDIKRARRKYKMA